MKKGILVGLVVIISLLSLVIADSDVISGDTADSTLLVVNNEVKTLQDAIDDNSISVARNQTCGYNTCIRGFDEFGVLCAYASPFISVGSCTYNNKCSSYSCGKGCTAWKGCWSCSIISGRNAGTGPIVSDAKTTNQKAQHLLDFINSKSEFSCPEGTVRDFRFISDGWVCRR